MFKAGLSFLQPCLNGENNFLNMYGIFFEPSLVYSSQAASLRDRSSLFGNSGQPQPASLSGRSSPYDQSYTANSQRYADDLEGQNDEQLEGLSAKVKMLKEVSELTRLHVLVTALIF